ncbi:hypothetical protein BDV23DRAFT_178400 [Aspergillus alliaceus]|uniref:Uncharacterized protein n=1 Tax=Petromyces alliaceus TaxID=209559 RepID=A0A5N7CNT5_PETAA|nr:hypothetical protein BDV23DRAFT_178400 [Aspergillus alliaceus]
MRLNFSYVALLLVGAAQPAFCAHNFKQTLSDFDAIENTAREFSKAVDNYHRGLAGAIAVGNKARQAGVANVAQGMVRHMQDTKEALRVAYQKKLPAEDERRMASTYENVDNAFNEANNALSE